MLILNKRPITHSYICDSTTSIQVEFKTEREKKIEDYDLNPWNKVMTHYYQVSHEHDKHYFTLNSNDKTLSDYYGINIDDTNYEPLYRSGGMFA